MALLEDKLGEWKPVSRLTGIAWLCFYALFLLYAFADRSGFLIVNYVNMIIHEGGHFFFSWFGNTIMILGGTIGELLVPLLCAIYFFCQREPPASHSAPTGCSKIFPTSGTYMADARSAALPLVGSEESDWTFSLASGDSSPRTKKSAQSCAPWAWHARHHDLAGQPRSPWRGVKTTLAILIAG